MITTAPIASDTRRHPRDVSIPSRPTTPLRPASRTSLRASQTTPSTSAAVGVETANGHDGLLDRLEPAFAELSDAVADLEANFMHLQLLNESIARFNENFASFLYGLNMTAFCVDFPEAPIAHSFDRHTSLPNHMVQAPAYDIASNIPQAPDLGTDATFMTGDTSFVEHPPTSTKSASKFSTNATTKRGSTSGSRGFASNARGRPAVPGTDEYGRRTTRLPSGAGRGRGSSTARARGTYVRG